MGDTLDRRALHRRLRLCGIVGLVILFLRVSRVRLLEIGSKLFIEFFQGTPLLMQLFLFFFGVALFGLDVSPWIAAGLALTLWTAAFLAEIWRGCVEAFQGSVGGLLQPRHDLHRADASRDPAAGGQDRDCPDRRLLGAGVKVPARVHHRLRGADEGRTMLNTRPSARSSSTGWCAIYFCLCFPLSWFARRLEGKSNVAAAR